MEHTIAVEAMSSIPNTDINADRSSIGDVAVANVEDVPVDHLGSVTLDESNAEPLMSLGQLDIVCIELSQEFLEAILLS